MHDVRLAAEIRSADLTGRTLTAYAAVYDQITDLGGGRLERLEVRSLDRAIAEADDVLCLFNHDVSRLLGRTRSGTLSVHSDDRGVPFTVELPDTPTGEEVRVLAGRGDLTGCSFAFKQGATRWDLTGDGRRVRSHLEVAKLIDVSIVTEPAYDGAGILSVRSAGLRPAPSGSRGTLARTRHNLRNRKGAS